MKRTLGTLSALLVLLLAAGCGDDAGQDSRADDPVDSPSQSAGSEPTDGPSEGGADFTQVALLSETSAGGEVSSQPTLLDTPIAVTTFAGTLEGRTLPAEIEAAVEETDVPDGQALVGSVVAIGCDVPPGVSVAWDGTVLDVTPLKVEQPTKECFAPVTTVALLLVDAQTVSAG